MNEKQARRHNRAVKRQRGFEKLAPRQISPALRLALRLEERLAKVVVDKQVSG